MVHLQGTKVTEWETIITDVANRATTGHGSPFANRADAIERLELHVLSRFDAAQQASYARADALRLQLEAANDRMARRLAARIATRRYTRAGLARAFARFATREQADDYDVLDLLLATVFDAGPQPDEHVALEPDMVAYQPTPGRAILDLIERAELGSDDVFVDLGSGLGWVVLLVACLSEARAIGIELEPTYCDSARSLASRLNLDHAEFVAADARTASLQAGTVYFMYTPFRGAMLQHILERLRVEAEQRAIRVCSYGPCTAELAQLRWLAPRRDDAIRDDEIVIFDTRM
jgi:hypothetical protein